MANTAKLQDQVYPRVVKPAVESTGEISYNKGTSDTVSIVLMIDATVKVTGTVTGTQYVFVGAGSIQSVNIQDKDELLNKKRGNSCCGGQSGKSIFALV